MYYYNDHCYTIINGSYNWSEAEAYCEELGGHLATVTSQGEQNFIMSINSSNQCLWLGGYRIGTNSWGWVTGETWSYTYWGEGEPNDSTNVVSEENRVCTFPMYWNDLNENNLYEQDGFICEWDDNTCIRYWIDYLGLASNDSEVNTADCFIRPIAGLYDTYFPIGQGSKLYLLGWALFDDGLDYLYYDLDGKQYKINGPYRNRSDASADTAPYYGRAGYHNGENAGFGNDGEYCELTAVRELKKGNHDIEIVAVSRYGNKHTLLYGTIYVE